MQFRRFVRLPPDTESEGRFSQRPFSLPPVLLTAPLSFPIQRFRHLLHLGLREKRHGENESGNEKAYYIRDNDRPFHAHEAKNRPERKAGNGYRVHAPRYGLGIPSPDDLPRLRNEAGHRADRSQVADHQGEIHYIAPHLQAMA